MPERIAIVSTSYPAHAGDASGHFVASEARALAAEGHAVTVFAGGVPGEVDANPRVVRLADGGATGWPGLVPRLRERKLRLLGLARFALRARTELRRRGPFDRVIAHWLVPAGFPIAALSALDGAALEVVVHGSDARLLERLPRPIVRGLVSALTRKGARFRCVSSELSEIVTRFGAGARHAVRVAASPIDVAPRTRVAARAALGVTPEARLVVVVGRLIASKRVREALSAAELVPDVEVVTIGDGPELATLSSEFPRVRFAGRLDRETTLDFIAAADAVLSASREEGASTVVREARALGVRVVAACSGALGSSTDPGVFVVR